MKSLPVVIPAKAGIHLLFSLVPTLCVGTQVRALRALRRCRRNEEAAERPDVGSHAEGGNQGQRGEGLTALAVALLLALPALAGSPDPWQAYARGDFESAREAFEAKATRRPGDLRLALDLGSARYQLGDFGGAEEAFARAARSPEPRVAAQAHYSLGNATYRQGRLEEAIGHWERTLSLAPGDADARFNLDLARRQLAERRHRDQPSPSASEPTPAVSEGQARRLLAALGEQRPTARPARPARRTASGKDW